MNLKIPVEDLEHLAFHPTDVPMLENAGTPRPNDAFIISPFKYWEVGV